MQDVLMGWARDVALRDDGKRVDFQELEDDLSAGHLTLESF
jgi:hypothetical protein